MLRKMVCIGVIGIMGILGFIGCGKGESESPLASANKSSGEITGSIQIKGSDTMVNLGQAWAEAFMKKYPKTSVAVTGGGSGTGIAALINGTCDIAECSRAMKDKEKQQAKGKGRDPIEFVVGLDGLAVVVHPANPISQLNTEQLRDIFMGTAVNWKDVGGNDQAITILSREVNSGTHVYFKEHVLRKGNEKGPEEYASSALLMSSSQSIADEVAQNKSAIGYYGMGYISSKQKVLAVSQKGSSFISPSLATVKNGTYPISRPLFMYTAGAPQGLVKTFLDFVLSAEGQEIVKKLDFVPVN
jgi:phosphate transport system substrate-binding protein